MRVRQARPPIAFRAVNRRGMPGHSAELQRHHLLPCQLLSQRSFDQMFAGIGRQRIGFDDFRVNGMLLPSNEESAMLLALPLHRGPHRQYNELVCERVGQIEQSWAKTSLQDRNEACQDALMPFSLLQSALRWRLLDTVGRQMLLNRRDPHGRAVDFTDLDAMAEALWGATEAIKQ